MAASALLTEHGLRRCQQERPLKDGPDLPNYDEEAIILRMKDILSRFPSFQDGLHSVQGARYSQRLWSVR